MAKKQPDFFEWASEAESAIDKKYTSKIKAPIYSPKQRKPLALELRDKSKCEYLIQKINNSGVSVEEKAFLTLAAYRHIVFNYRLIADYYSHSDSEMQDLMEQSALVIIDFNKAIEYGYVKLSEDIAGQYLEDTADGK